MASARPLGSQDQAQQLSTLLNSSKVQLVPYVQYGKEWTLPDSSLANVAMQAMSDGVFNVTFYDGSVSSPADFIESMKSEDKHPIFAFSDNNPIGFSWVNGIRENYCFAHFCSLSAGWGGLAEHAGKMILNYWFNIVPRFEFILGQIPGPNVRAQKFVKRLGFRKVGEIPDMLMMSGNRVASVFYYYSRFDHA